MRWYLVLLMAAGICLVVSANPALSDQASESVFKAMDKDGDGKITAQEYLAACKRGEEKCTEDFKWFDRNKDGNVTLPEYEGKVKK